MTQYKHLPSNIGFSLFALVYNQGGAHEIAEKSRGISHLMEHLLCKTFDDQRQQLRRFGIGYNASTSDNRTIFYWDGLNEEVEQITPLMLERVTKHTSTWTEEGFMNERETVLQEYADCFNDQFKGFYYNIIRKHYGICGAIGFKSDIEAFSYEDSLNALDKYKNPNLVIQVGINTLKDEMFGKALEHTARELVFTEDSGVALENIPKDNKTIVGLLGRTPMDRKLISKMYFLIGCLNDGLESPMYQEIREKRGLSYFSAAMNRVIGKKFVPFFGASTTNERAQELRDVYTDIFSRDLCSFLDYERFEICLDELRIQERKDILLAHDGASRLLLSEENPYDALRNISYDEIIELGNTHLNINSFEPVSY